jgi:hypothetical protein
MLIVNIKGGLGNQVFQLLASYRFAQINKINKIYIFKWNLNLYNPPRKYNLKNFTDNNKYKIIYLNLFWIIILNKYFLAIYVKLNILIINESNFYHNKHISNLFILDGYFQDDIFIDNHSISQIQLGMKSPKFDVLRKLRNYNIKISDLTLGLHFRFTDRYSIDLFKSYKIQIEKFNFDNFDNIIIFSDDYSLTKELFKYHSFKYIMAKDLYLNDQEEFLLISLIPNFYIQNSTFSIIARVISTENILTYLDLDMFLDIKIYNLLKNNLTIKPLRF